MDVQIRSTYEDFEVKQLVWLHLVQTFGPAGLLGPLVELLPSAKFSQYCIFTMVSQSHYPTFTCSFFFIYTYIHTYLFLCLFVFFGTIQFFLILSLTVPWAFYDTSRHFFIFFYIFENWYKIVHLEADCLL